MTKKAIIIILLTLFSEIFSTVFIAGKITGPSTKVLSSKYIVSFSGKGNDTVTGGPEKTYGMGFNYPYELWQGRVTPNQEGFIFEPSYRDYPVVIKNYLNQDFEVIDTMAPNIVVDSPSVGDIIVLRAIDTIVTILSDNAQCLSKLIYYLSIDSGQNYAFICSLTIFSNGGYPIPASRPFSKNHINNYTFNNISNNCIIKVEGIDPDGNIGIGYSGLFSVIDTTKPTVLLTSPISNEKWDIGTTHNITWTANDNVSIISRNIYFNNGTNWNELDNASGNTGSWSWTIPGPSSNQCRIRIRVYDQSGNIGEAISGLFEICDTLTPDTIKPIVTIIAPVEGENVPMGVNYEIKWTANDNKGIISRKIEWKYGSYRLIDSSSGNSGSYLWLVQNSLNLASCKIRITVYDTAGNYSSDSTGFFQIKDLTPPTITIKDPRKGQVFIAKCPVALLYIRFETTDINGLSLRSLYYSLDGGTNYTQLGNSISLKDSISYKESYTWNICNIHSNNCRIKFMVWDTRGNCQTAISDSFVIDAPTMTNHYSVLPHKFNVTVSKNNILIAMEKPDKVVLTLYNLRGRKIWENIKLLSAGFHRIHKDSIKGIYLLKISRPDKELIKKIQN